MTLFINQIRKDISLNRGYLLLCVVFGLVNAWLFSDPLRLVERGGTSIQTIGMVMQALEILIMAVVIPKLIQDDNLVSLDAAWLTRPIDGRTLMTSKLTLALFLFIVYPIVCECISLSLLGDFRAFGPVVLSTLVQKGFFVFTLIAISAVLRNMSQVLLAFGAVVLAGLVLQALSNIIGIYPAFLNRNSWIGLNAVGQLWGEGSKWAVISLATAVFGGCSVYVSFVLRRSGLAKTVLLVAAIICWGITRYWSFPIWGPDILIVEREEVQVLSPSDVFIFKEDVLVNDRGNHRSERRLVMRGMLDSAKMQQGQTVASLLLNSSLEIASDGLTPAYDENIYRSLRNVGWDERTTEAALNGEFQKQTANLEKSVEIPLIDLSEGELEKVRASANGTFIGKLAFVYSHIDKLFELPMKTGVRANRFGYFCKVSGKESTDESLIITVQEGSIRRLYDQQNIGWRGDPINNRPRIRIGIQFTDTGKFTFPDKLVTPWRTGLVGTAIAEKKLTWDLDRILTYGDLAKAQLVVVEQRLSKIEHVTCSFGWNDEDLFDFPVLNAELHNYSDNPIDQAIDEKSVVLSEVVEDRKIPDMQVAMAINGEMVWSQHFGWSGISVENRAHLRSKMRIGSISKSMTGMLLLRLADKGEIDLDAKVGDLVLDGLVPEEIAAASLRQIAGHLGGIRHFRKPEDYVVWAKAKSIDEGLEIFQRDPWTGWHPGEKFEYSSYGYALLGSILQRETGRSFEGLLKSELSEPLGLGSIGVENPNASGQGVARIYRINDSGIPTERERDNSPFRQSSGGLLACAEDLVSFGIKAINNNFLSEKSLISVLTSQYDLKGNATGYSIGWQVLSRKKGAPLVLQHTGKVEGGLGVLVVIPEKRAACSILMNVQDERAMSIALEAVDDLIETMSADN